ncbi:MAG: ATP-dependent DNA helicase [Actinomycetaceae bacterium]|nr:ATP-dependent DNA helicase [Actinomycetaceae bacterium]
MSEQGLDTDASRVLNEAITLLGGSPRAGQQEMCAAIATTLEEDGHLIVQAGTGTGKSLGYLAPAATLALNLGQPVVVSTATLALQRQIMTKDAPLIQEACGKVLGQRPRVEVLKGWSNYVCVHKLAGGYKDDTLFDESQTGDYTSVTGLSDQLKRAQLWAGSSSTGDRDDLIPGVKDIAWKQLSVSKAECLGKECPVKSECFAFQARTSASQADIIVTNHSILGITATSKISVLPEFAAVIVDEAHELVDRVRSQSSVELSVRPLSVLANRLQGLGLDTQGLKEAAEQLREALTVIDDGRIAHPIPQVLHDVLAVVGAESKELFSALSQRDDDEDTTTAGTKQQLRAGLFDVIDFVQGVIDGQPQGEDLQNLPLPTHVLWCSRGSDGMASARLYRAPLDVAEDIAQELWEGRGVILTSATLNLGGSFEPIAAKTGMTRLSQPWKHLDVGTPFELQKQGILYTAGHLPPPGRDGIDPQVWEEMADLVSASGGGMLGLFSSHKAAQHAASYLRAETDYPIFAQGDDQLSTLLEEFRNDERACLVGTLSLWQGVDAPGHTCRLVVIDRIPFPRPTDPVIEALSESVKARGGSDFFEVSMTHAALLLAQGAGRLLRSPQDRGVVAVLDSRIETKRYGTFLLRSLPPMWRTNDPLVVRQALKRLSGREIGSIESE